MAITVNIADRVAYQSRDEHYPHRPMHGSNVGTLLFAGHLLASLFLIYQF